MKRILIIILVVLLAGVAGFILFTKNEVIFTKETSLYKAVPLTSPVFVEFSSLRVIPNDNVLLNELKGIEEFDLLLNRFLEINSSITTSSSIPNQIAKRPFVLALDFIGKNVLKPIIISELKSSDEFEGFKKLIELHLGTPASSFTSRNYDGYKIFEANDSASKSQLHFCATNGLVIISGEAMLVEKCLRQLTSENITDIKYFQRVNKTVTAQSEISWYINHSRFPDLWSNMLNSETHKKVNEFGETDRINLKRAIQNIENYASWSELDLSFEENYIALDGITAADDSLNNFLSVFEGQEAVNSQWDRVLPKNTSFFIGFTFSEKELFFTNLEKYFELSKSYFARESKLKRIKKSLGVTDENPLRKLVNNQVVAAITNVPAETEKKSTLFILNNDKGDNIQELFESLLQNYARRNNMELDTLISSVKVNNSTDYRVYRFPYPSLPGLWLGKAFAFSKTNYATFYNNNLVFGDSEATLKKYLNDMISDKSLYKNLAYAEFKISTESKSNISAYLNISRAYNLNTSIFNTDFKKAFKKNEEIFSKFDAFGWQVVCDKNIYFNSIHLAYKTQKEVDSNALWQTELGAELAMKPQLVINHTNKTEKEIIVQDVDNNLHLIGSNGKVNWSAPVKGKILGKIHQVDYYRNGRLQYLFNTKEKLYLLDRNGKMVAKFPVVFKSPASNGVNVFDYDNNRKYRYFVACENKKVYAYNHEGQIITGWKFEGTSSSVTNPVEHFRVNNKDFIVFKDNTKVYIQNRQGHTRIKTAVTFENSKNPLVLNTNGTPKIVASDKSGKVYYFYFDGKYAEKKTERFGKDHFFTVADINGNGIADFIFVDNKELTVIDENGKKVFSKKFRNILQSEANVYAFSSKQKKIGVCDTKTNEIYLFNPDGTLHEGFPLEGNTAFSIGNLTKETLNLVVGNEGGNLSSYLLE
jgi:hypothetical protein